MSMQRLYHFNEIYHQSRKKKCHVDDWIFKLRLLSWQIKIDNSSIDFRLNFQLMNCVEKIKVTNSSPAPVIWWFWWVQTSVSTYLFRLIYISRFQPSTIELSIVAPLCSWQLSRFRLGSILWCSCTISFMHYQIVPVITLETMEQLIYRRDRRLIDIKINAEPFVLAFKRTNESVSS